MGDDMERIGKSVRVVETGGVKLKDTLVRADLTGCIWPGCLLCRDGAPGNHTRRGAVYSRECKLCGDSGITARYDGETGHSGYQRVNMGHRKDIVSKNINNAFARHLKTHHPEHQGDHSKFKFSISTVSKTSLLRQVTEGVMIHNSNADIQLNGKSEWHQPATRRIEMTQEPRHGVS